MATMKKRPDTLMVLAALIAIGVLLTELLFSGVFPG